MRIALAHDAIFCRAGGERVLLNFHNAFPDAPIYTSIYDPKNSYPEFNDCDIKTTWLQNIAPNEKWYKRTFFPLGLWAMQSHKLSEYDVILTTTTHCAKYIQVKPSSLVINYCFTPFRLAWDPTSYNLYGKSKGFKRCSLDFVIKILRKMDFSYSQRADKYIAMTDETAQRIKEAYKPNNKITILNPSIDTSKYYLSNKIEDYYLVVSRLEKYKKVDLVINAFNKLGFKLKIVGRGIEKESLKKIANSNIEFIEGINDEKLAGLYSKCRAFIFPQHEDYGLTPLEANASGRPVIAYHRGGVETTMVPFNKEKPESPFTALFFNEQNIKSLISAVQSLNKLKIDSFFIRNHAEKFDDNNFINKIKEFVSTEFTIHKEKNKG